MTLELIVDLGIQSTCDFKFPYAVILGRYPKPAIIRYMRDGEKQSQSLRLDLHKPTFLDHIDDQELKAALREVGPRIIELVASHLPPLLEETACRYLFPAEAPELPGFDLAGKGQAVLPLIRDYIDFVPSQDGSLIIACGWAVGLSAYTTVRAIQTRTAIRSIATFCSDPGEILTRVNQILSSNPSEHVMSPTRIAVLNPDRTEIQFSDAGSLGYLINQDGKLKGEIETNLPLGIAEDLTYSNGPVIPLEDDDIYVTCNDGILFTETPRHESFGEERLIRFVHSERSLSAQDIVGKLYTSLSNFRSGMTPQEGSAIIVMKVLGTGVM